MDILAAFKEKAKKLQKHIVLPEGSDIRVLQAASDIMQQGLARITVIGNEQSIMEHAKKEQISLDGVTIVNPETSDKLTTYAQNFYELRKSKGVTLEDAQKVMKDEIYFGTMMVHVGDADGLVAGAAHATGDTVRPSFQIIKPKPGMKTVSGYFLMKVPDCEFGDNGLFLFADSGVNPNPTAEQLAEIAITSAETARALCGMEPYVAMLSFSTKGSAQHELIDKVVEATRIAKEKAPELNLDGELQVDAALVPTIGEKKAPGSSVSGKANVLIFPDLQSGNIAYKIVERLAKATALGPLLQGLNKPVNDLSRGCSADDIVNIVAITAIQSTI